MIMRRTGKTIAGLLCIAMCASLFTGCGSAEDNKAPEETVSETAEAQEAEADTKQETDTTEKPETETPEAEPEEEEAEPDYEEIYEPVFAEALDMIYNGYDWEKEYTYVSDGLMEEVMYSEPDELAENIGYLIEDISGDGIPELLIGHDADWDETGLKSYVFNVFTIKDDEIHTTFSGWARSSYIWLGDGYFSYFGSSGYNNSVFGKNHLSEDGSQIIWDDFYLEREVNGQLGFYHNTEGFDDETASEKLDITEEEFWKLDVGKQGKQIGWTPIGTHGSKAKYATDGVAYFNIPGPGKGTVKADLDGDGNDDEIGYVMEADADDILSYLELTIDGETCELKEGIGDYFAGSGLNCFWFRDDDADNSQYLYVQYTTYSDYQFITIYKYAEGTLKYADDLDGMVMFSKRDENGEWVETAPEDPDSFYVRTIEQKMGTQSYYEKCKLGTNGHPESIDEYKYYNTGNTAYISTSKDITCEYYATEFAHYTEEDRVIPKGTMVIPYRTDGDTFIDLKVEGADGIYRILTEQNGDGHWSLSIVDGLEGSNELEDCFDGLTFAG